MNRRILKKLCKRASGLLPNIGDTRKQFLCTDQYQGDGWCSRKMERKSRERHGQKADEHGYFTPLNGTIGIGNSCGEFECEWTDEPAWYALVANVRDGFTDWSYPSDGHPKPTRRLTTPTEILRSARLLIVQKEKGPEQSPQPRGRSGSKVDTAPAKEAPANE